MPAETETSYRVLARKYRPARFADMVGQEATVRTLTNAIGGGRVAQAFMLTGVRGVGKTTTARIIARALNCIGPDGQGGPTPEPCGVCEHCRAITEDRHVDVIEMDAASRTGVDDIRELIDGVRYRPVSARNKVYILDEVHMLSKSAFNALLKTLEEPPPQVIFIFATTELRKVPVTVLSRCQRYELRRVAQDVLARYYGEIAEREAIEIEAEALALIGRAADGSVRDGLSLLDQAIALTEGKISAAAVSAMLGLADRGRVFDLLEAVLGGRVTEALDILGELYASGAEPAMVIEDLLELVHFATRTKLVPATLKDPALPEAERKRGGTVAERLSLAQLARAWQLLLKGLGEVQDAGQPLPAAEMLLIRLAHASELPAPAELVRQLSGGMTAETRVATHDAAETAAVQRSAPRVPRASGGSGGGTPQARLAVESEAQPAGEIQGRGKLKIESFAAMIEVAREKREPALALQLAEDVHLVRFEQGRIEFRPCARAPRDLANRLGRLLGEWTGERWLVSVSGETGAAPLAEQQRAQEQSRRDALLDDPLVKAALETFPSARLIARRDAEPSTVSEGDEEMPPPE